MKCKLSIGAILLIACFAGRAAAHCTLSATGVVFGNYISTAPLTITGTITVTCSANETFQIGLNAGTGSGATVTTRSMSGPGSASLAYGLFSDAMRTDNWGDTSGTGWVTGQGTGNGHPQDYTVYAQIPANQSNSTGTYNDVITIFLTGNFNTLTAQFNVTATVSPSCTIAANSLNFGAYTGLLTNSTSTIAVTCTNTTQYSVGLDAGLATGATVTSRRMAGPATAMLAYNLFSNAARSSNWGNTPGRDTLAGTGNGNVQYLSVYGQIPAGQLVSPGGYADTIRAILTY